MACLPADAWRASHFRVGFCLLFLVTWGLGMSGLPKTSEGAPWQEEPAIPSTEETADSPDGDDPDGDVVPATSEPAAEIEDAPIAPESGPLELGHAPGTSAEADPHAAAHDGHRGADGDHHDPYDLSEANGGPNLFSPADLKFDLAIYTVVVFLLLFAGLYKFAWGPICRGLAIREDGIAAKIEEAHVAAAQAVEKLKEYESRLAAATEEARTIIQQAHQDAQRSSERIIAEAQERADRERVRAVADIEAAKNVALESISQRTVELAMLMAGRIVRKELNESDHAQLIRDTLDKLPSRN